MTRDPASWTWAEATHPATPAAELAEMAANRPDLRPGIASNPSTYPDLRTWLGQLGDPSVNAALAGGVAVSTAAAPPAAAPPTAPSSVHPYEAAHPYEAVSGSQGPAAYAMLPNQADLQLKAASAAAAAASAPKPRNRKKIALIAGGSAFAVLVASGAGAAIWWRTTMDGATSAEGAVTDLLTAAASKDPLPLFGALAPSERNLLRTGAERVQSTVPGGSSNAPLGSEVQDLMDAVQIEFDPASVKLRVNEVSEDVSIVEVRSGEVTITVDAASIADVVTDWSAERVNANDYSARSQDVQDYLNEAIQVVDGSHTFTVRDFEEQTGADLIFVSVKEGGRWFVSPMMTVAEYAYVEASEWEDLPRRGDEVLEAGDGYDTPEAAVEGLTDLRFSSNGQLSKEVIEALPLAERRLASIYGVTLTNLSDPPRFDLTVERADVTGATASVYLSDLWSNEVDWSWEDDVQPHLDGVSGPDPTLRGLLGTSSILRPGLSLENLPIGAVKEGGRWYVSPLHTVVTLIAAGDVAASSDDVDDAFDLYAELLWDAAQDRLDRGGSDSDSADSSANGGLPQASDPWFTPEALYADDVSACYSGDLAACDSLYNNTPSDSEEEYYGATCGDRTYFDSGTCVQRLGQG